MKQVTIVGLGLIGASLGLALKQLKNPPSVIGNDAQYDAATHASRLKAVDRVERNLLDAVSGSDLVIVATPVSTIPEVMRAIVPALANGCVVTDTGSTKREVVRLAQEILPPSASFVGGHPMTGRATGGVDDPSASIFENAVYCLTPVAATPPDAVATVAAMVQQVGASPYFLDPAEHDGLVAGISHFPYLVSATLMRILASETSWREMSDLAAGGFELSTRLAGHDAKVFGDILSSNADNVVHYLDRFVAELSSAREKLVSGQPRLNAEMEEAHRQRVEWEQKRRHAQEARK
jgi:prephenate dehydrogenase